MEMMIYLFVLAVLLYCLRSVLAARHGKWWWWAAICGHGLLLAVLIVFFSNAPSLIAADQVGLIKKTVEVNTAERENAGTFVRNNFLCIDVAGDREFFDGTDQMSGLPVTESITRRSSLKSLLDFLIAEKKYIDLVVLDLDLSSPSNEECSIRDRIYELYREDKKIILSGPAPADTDTCSFLPAQVYADVSYEKDATGSSLSHKILKEDNFSLAYRIYSKISGASAKSILFGSCLKESYRDGHWSLALNEFLPVPLLNDSSIVRSHRDLMLRTDITGDRAQRLTFLQLGDLEDAGVAANISDSMHKRKLNSKCANIVFVGNFIGTDDLHSTAIGDQHGPGILINIVYSLSQHKHIFNLWTSLFLTVLLILVSFFLVYIILYDRDQNRTIGLLPRRIRISLDSLLAWSTAVLEHPHHGWILKFFSTFAGILINEIHLVLVLVASLIFYWFTGNLPNAILLVLYFAAAGKFLKHYFKYHSI